MLMVFAGEALSRLWCFEQDLTSQDGGIRDDAIEVSGHAGGGLAVVIWKGAV